MAAAFPSAAFRAEPCRRGRRGARFPPPGQKISEFGIYPCKLYKNMLESKKYVVQECNLYSEQVRRKDGKRVREEIRPAHGHLYGGGHRDRVGRVFQGGIRAGADRRQYAAGHSGVADRWRDHDRMLLCVCHHGHPVRQGQRPCGLCRGHGGRPVRLFDGLVRGRHLHAHADQRAGVGVGAVLFRSGWLGHHGRGCRHRHRQRGGPVSSSARTMCSTPSRPVLRAAFRCPLRSSR